MKRVAIIGGSPQYRRLFEALGFDVIENYRKADLICFTGGADVMPELYGDAVHPQTFFDPRRDGREQYVFDVAQELKIPVVGICRGGQFLNVMSGGRMYQHVSKHTQSHSITDLETGETIYVSSTHHQMMMPSEKAKLVATANNGGFREWYDGTVARRDVSKEDIEVVYYEHTNALCFQPHPEFDGVEYEGMKAYFKSLLQRFFGM